MTDAVPEIAETACASRAKCMDHCIIGGDAAEQQGNKLEKCEANPELFNYKALNPTVEVYVGDCDEVNQYGECIDEASQENQ